MEAVGGDKVSTGMNSWYLLGTEQDKWWKSAQKKSACCASKWISFECQFGKREDAGGTPPPHGLLQSLT